MTTDFETLHKEYDRSDMYGRIARFPQQMEDAWGIGQEFAAGLSRGRFQRVVVCGMGGSAIGGDMARSFLGSRLRVPLISCRDYEAPPYLRDDSLVVLSSYSGNTGETLSAFESLRGGTSSFVAVTSGGTLAKLCAEREIPVCRIPGGMPPRSAIGYSLLPTLQVLRASGAADFDDSEFEEALGEARARCVASALESGGGRAAEIAGVLHGRLPFVYAGPGLLEAVARRWACQLNENANTLAHYAIFTELDHNEIVGWEALPEIRERSVVVSLEDPDDHEMTRRQTDVTMDIVGPQSAGVIRVDSGKLGRLARMFTTMLLGDFTSLYLALLGGVDPTPVEKIDFLKSQLSG